MAKKTIPASWEKGKLDKKLDRVHGAKEGSPRDNTADRRAMAQKAKGMSDEKILAEARKRVGKPQGMNKLMKAGR